MSGLSKKIQGTLFASTLIISSWGCQSNSMMNMPWNQATRVPPPNAPSNLPSSPYANPINPNPTNFPMQPNPAGQPNQTAPKSVSAYSVSPFTDAVASAQNELKLATDNARAAIEKSANSVNSTVSQAGATLDRVGSGVVQATGILESSLYDPAPVPSTISGSSGSITDTPTEDPNSQWRKPIPR
ncbi:MAG: hypothetical protein WCP62_02185 [Planctomycetota bacterium]